MVGWCAGSGKRALYGGGDGAGVIPSHPGYGIGRVFNHPHIMNRRL